MPSSSEDTSYDFSAVELSSIDLDEERLYKKKHATPDPYQGPPAKASILMLKLLDQMSGSRRPQLMALHRQFNFLKKRVRLEAADDAFLITWLEDLLRVLMRKYTYGPDAVAVLKEFLELGGKAREPLRQYWRHINIEYVD